MLYNAGRADDARAAFTAFRQAFDAASPETRGADPEVLEQQAVMGQLLGVM